MQCTEGALLPGHKPSDLKSWIIRVAVKDAGSPYILVFGDQIGVNIS